MLTHRLNYRVCKLKNFRSNFANQSYRISLLLVDMVLVVVAFVASYYFDAAGDMALAARQAFAGPHLFLLLLGAVGFALLVGSHRLKADPLDTESLQRLAIWVVLVVATSFLISFFLGDMSALAIVSFGLVLFALVLVFRLLDRFVRERYRQDPRGRIPVAVYGAGAGGIQLVAALRKSSEYDPVLLVDDSKHLQGLKISGLRVHDRATLEVNVASGTIHKVLFAIPSISQSKKRQVMEYLGQLDCEVQEIPSYVDIIKSGGVFRSLRTVQPEALLGRADVAVEVPQAKNIYHKRNVLITGGGGSIGSELSRRLLEFRPDKLVLLDSSELALYQIEQELGPIATAAGIELVPILGSVLDKPLVDRLVENHAIEVILHAAAHKHVPLLEDNILAGVRNNIFGTKVVAEVAAEKKVSRFTLISTDKAVRPTNLMGATKRFAELVVQDLQSRHPDTVFSMVRFGNVLGSSGSVIPLFKKQIEDGGPVTVTHKDVTRYFMTIPEAARLVLLSNAFSEGGDVFVLDMGEPIRIVDMARQMIELSGLSVRDEQNPEGDIEIEIKGLRPGEKLFEELLIDENILPTHHAKIMRAKEKKLTAQQLAGYLAKLERALAKFDETLAIETLKLSVEGYKPE